MTNTHVQSIVALCRDCAASIYDTRPPSPAYAECVARLLAGTAAQESRLVHRRQHGFSWSQLAGAWGLWQTEHLPVTDNIDYIAARPALFERALTWVWGEAYDYRLLTKTTPLQLMTCIAGNDRLSVLMARIHYMRRPEAIPNSVQAQATYYKEFYNTVAGKATTAEYKKNYQTLIAPVFDSPDMYA